MSLASIEKERIASSPKNMGWKIWGPYVTERQWGTVREDYSTTGESWDFISHEKARSNAYRWGEEGIAAFCDMRQVHCIAPVFWNGKDSIIKERLFGLTNGQGNHGEDVKELYFHQLSSPTHSYSKYLYKYPHAAYPYSELVEQNRRSRYDREFEILDSNVFSNNAYFDCYVEYAKYKEEDVLMKITVINRGDKEENIHILPHFWYRNYWKHNPTHTKPEMKAVDTQTVVASSDRRGLYHFYHEGGIQLFCDNETNNERLYGFPSDTQYPKDGINDFLTSKKRTVNPEKTGTKMAAWHNVKLAPGATKVVRCRVSKTALDRPWEGFDDIFETRISETLAFYDDLIPQDSEIDRAKLMQDAFSGLLWTKQYYYLDMHKWLFGGPGEAPPARGFNMRNYDWQHITNRDIISMPDKWEYPWYAAWDLAFHTTTFAHIDPDFAKEQLLLFLTDYYMHGNGQIPAYEWNFSDVNPPVHGWAVWQVYEKDKQKTGKADLEFLRRAFHKLAINYTWWVNQKDKNGSSLFDGGFLGLDNIGVFDRNHMPSGIKNMQQADATSWMAMFSLNMLRMALELANDDSSYEDSASKYLRHFLNIAWSMHNIGSKDISLWDQDDNFYYDVVALENGTTARLKVRSLVGIIPLFAIEVMSKSLFSNLDEYNIRLHQLITTRPDLASLVSRIEQQNGDGNILFSIMRGFRLEHVLKRLLDENEFLSDYGIRSLSKYHKDHPFVFTVTNHSINYDPGESTSAMFGGNSNWRGPIWFPLNYLIVQSLRKYYTFYGPEYIYEFPTGSGVKLNLRQIANEITLRLAKLFSRDENGKYVYHTDNHFHSFTNDPHFKDHHLFYEFFDGDTGRGLGASHQTGWSALIANLLLEIE